MNEYNGMNVRASAPGKLTLFGEHFVVYGNPAILAAINKRISITLKPNGTDTIRIRYAGMQLSVPIVRGRFHKDGTSSTSFLYPILSCMDSVQHYLGDLSGLDVSIESQVPDGEGLGSSAASCVAMVGALQSLFFKEDRSKIFEVAAQAERIIHKNSSGADCYASTFGGILHYKPTSGHKRISIKKKLLFMICTTGIKHKTRNLVSRVKRMKENNPAAFIGLAERAKNICSEAKRAMMLGDHRTLGMLLTENHDLLKKLNVSHPKLDELIDICTDNGALGCKLTGAGGGGAVIALIPNHNNRKTISEIRKKIPQSILAELDFNGIQITQSLNSDKKF